jgi:hypothetical protein
VHPKSGVAPTPQHPGPMTNRTKLSAHAFMDVLAELLHSGCHHATRREHPCGHGCVSARNAVGESEASAPSNSIMPAAAPGARAGVVLNAQTSSVSSLLGQVRWRDLPRHRRRLRVGVLNPWRWQIRSPEALGAEERLFQCLHPAQAGF